MSVTLQSPNKNKSIKHLTEDFLAVMHSNSESYTKSLFTMLTILLEVNKDYGKRLVRLEDNMIELTNKNSNLNNVLKEVKEVNKISEEDRETLIIDNVIKKILYKFNKEEKRDFALQTPNNFDNVLFDKNSIYNKLSTFSEDNILNNIDDNQAQEEEEYKEEETEENKENDIINNLKDNQTNNNDDNDSNEDKNEYNDIRAVNLPSISINNDSMKTSNKDIKKPSIRKDTNTNKNNQEKNKITYNINTITENKESKQAELTNNKASSYLLNLANNYKDKANQEEEQAEETENRRKLNNSVAGSKKTNNIMNNNTYTIKSNDSEIWEAINKLKRSSYNLEQGVGEFVLNHELDKKRLEEKIDAYVTKAADESLNNKNLIYGFDEKIVELNGKIAELDIYSTLMNKDGGNTEGGLSTDQTIMLIKTLEKKLLNKIESIDNKNKEIEGSIQKVKTNELVIIKNIDELTELNNNLKSNISQFKNQQDGVNKQLQEQIDNFNTIHNDFVVKLEDLELKQQRLNLSQIEDFNMTQNEIKKEEMNNGDNINIVKNIEYDDTKIRIINRKIKDIEKNFINFIEKVNIDSINDKLETMKNRLILKAEQVEVKDLREAHSNINSQLEYLKDEISILSENNKIFEDFNTLTKRVDNLWNSVQIIKNGNDYGLPGGKNKNKNNNQNLDLSKYVDIFMLNELKEKFKEDTQNIENYILNIRRQNEEYYNSLSTKASNNDLKSTEDFLLAKIEENKALNLRKFSDRNETNKNLKYIDNLIKNLTEQVNKRLEKAGDNWLLAKRPIYNYQCASCEAFIGDLKDPHVKKLPAIEDKIYRSGAGYSKMLELIGNKDPEKLNKIDLKAIKGNIRGNNSVTNKAHNQSNNFRKKLINDNLSKSHYKEDANGNNTVTNKINQEEENDGVELSEPQVVNIFRKQK